MVHDHHVHIVEEAQFDKLLLAAQEGDLALFFQLAAVLNLGVFLSGDGDEGDIAGEFLQYAAVF